ncbi:MAG: UDP binding domain-containing protein, partial [Pseudomonadota bacterium]
GIHFTKNPYDALDGADAMVIITEWDQFRALDLERVKATLKGNVVVDLRNIYSPDDMARRGFDYTSIGRPV